ncbi:MAG: hypothetical protein ABI646_04250 [Acidobacteriota bacterium]
MKYNTVTLQIDRPSWRRSMDGCRVTVYPHIYKTITIGFGPQELGKYTSDGRTLNRLVRKTRDLKSKRLAAPLPNRQTGHLMC